MIVRSKDPIKTFNKYSAKLKEDALKDGLIITSEWENSGCMCWHAEKPQSLLKSISPGRFAEAGACINMAPKIWYTMPLGPRIFETVFLKHK